MNKVFTDVRIQSGGRKYITSANTVMLESVSVLHLGMAPVSAGGNYAGTDTEPTIDPSKYADQVQPLNVDVSVDDEPFLKFAVLTTKTVELSKIPHGIVRLVIKNESAFDMQFNLDLKFRKMVVMEADIV